MRLIDSHTHIDPKWDLGEIIKKAKEAGVVAIVAMASNMETCKLTLKCSMLNPGYVYPALGIHPSDVQRVDVEKTIIFIEENLDEAVAIGEIGLDYFYKSAQSKETRELQRKVFVHLLNLAKEVRLPVSVHSRNATRDALELAQEHGPDSVVFHWYDGSTKDLEKILDSGYYISATPAAEYSMGHRAALMMAPMKQILVETDSPLYIKRLKRRTEPADVTISLRALAELKCMSLEDAARVTSSNAEKVYCI